MDGNIKPDEPISDEPGLSEGEGGIDPCHSYPGQEEQDPTQVYGTMWSGKA